MFLDAPSMGEMAEMGEPGSVGHSTSPRSVSARGASPASRARVNAASSVLPGVLPARKQLWKSAGHLPMAHAGAGGLH